MQESCSSLYQAVKIQTVLLCVAAARALLMGGLSVIKPGINATSFFKSLSVVLPLHLTHRANYQFIWTINTQHAINITLPLF